jgi:hypothetical protein
VPVTAGIGLVETHYDETAIIEAFHPNEMLEGEMRLLREAKRLGAQILFGKFAFWGFPQSILWEV